jgi:hypothetical protein
MYLFHNGGVLARTVGAMTAGAIVRWARDGRSFHKQ